MGTKMLILIRTMVLLMVCFGPISALAQSQSLTKVTGDVYRFKNNNHYALVTVTDQGAVVVDPINANAAGWLKNNLKSITDKPVTHLIYSHSHGDHASGGSVFADDGAKTIAQGKAPKAIAGVNIDQLFQDKLTLEVSNKTFELTYLGVGHGDDLIAVVVRPENVAFIVDVASPKRLPYRNMPGSDIEGWINQLKVLEGLDFEIFAPGHGKLGVKADVADARIYMETLWSEVSEGLKAGKSADELANSVTLDAYKDWSQYDSWRELNVRGMVNYLKRSGKGE